MSTALTEKPNAEPLPGATPGSVVVEGRYLPPPADKDGKTWVRTSATIEREAMELYALWHDVERIPQWQELIAEVRRTGDKTSHWVARDGDKTVEWDSETMADEPGKRIAWRSVSGEPQNAGEVMFAPAPAGRGTYVTVLQEFGIGKVAELIATISSRDPKQAVIENLRHFKALAETGEIPRIEPQPHGDRGLSGSAKQSLYGEKIPTPEGTL